MTLVWQIHKFMADMKTIVRTNIAFILSLYIWISVVEEHRNEIDEIIKEIEGRKWQTI